ncbi:hypothetical protein ACFL0T_01230 [Candidatus Omnitrophota bacterium]
MSETIKISQLSKNRLEKLCHDKKLVTGADYYKVPDYNKAISYLLNRSQPKKMTKKKK